MPHGDDWERPGRGRLEAAGPSSETLHAVSSGVYDVAGRREPRRVPLADYGPTVPKDNIEGSGLHCFVVFFIVFASIVGDVRYYRQSVNRKAIMKNANPPCGNRAGAAACGFLLCVGALTAAAYDSTSLDGNLQNQCNDFGASVVSGTSFTITANCNKEGGGTQSTSFDLSGDVSYDTSDYTVSWDTALSDTVTDIADSCSPKFYAGGVNDIKLVLTCAGTTANVWLGLNGNLQVGKDGNLKRR